MKSQGFGDTVAKIIKVTKIDKLANSLIDGDFNCNERQDTLNRIFPYKK